MLTQDAKSMLLAVYDIYNQHTTDQDWLSRSSEYTSDEAEIENVPIGMTFHGKEGIKQFLSGWATAFPDSTVEVTNLQATDTFAYSEFIGRGTHNGILRSPMGDIPPTGKSVEIRFCEVFLLRDGQIVQERLYYDLMGMLQQLGLVQLPA